MDTNYTKLQVGKLIDKIRLKKPLIHCLTNYVTVNDCANAILALGGSPTMSNYKEEVEEVVEKANALVINIGTLSKEMLESMIIAGKRANEKGIPIIFDPVGVTSSNFRKRAAFEILDKVKVSVIRGNKAEIKTLFGIEGKGKGVDSAEDFKEEKEEFLLECSRKFKAIIAMTGAIDYISNGENIIEIHNGNRIMEKITGCGCIVTSIVGTFLGVTNNYYLATIAGVLTVGIAGDNAYNNLKENEGSGTFRVKLIDGIYNISNEDIKEGKIYEEY